MSQELVMPVLKGTGRAVILAIIYPFLCWMGFHGYMFVQMRPYAIVINEEQMEELVNAFVTEAL